MKDDLRRAIRTFGQSLIGTFVLIGFPVLQNIYDTLADGGDVAFDINVWKRIGIACLISGVIALVSYVQNWLEDQKGLPAVLKSPPSPGRNPLPEDGGQVA